MRSWDWVILPFALYGVWHIVAGACDSVREWRHWRAWEREVRRMQDQQRRLRPRR